MLHFGAMERAADVIRHYLVDPEHSWSIGVPGAIGEFMYDADEPVELNDEGSEFEIKTSRGAMSLRIPEATRCVAYQIRSHVTRSPAYAASFFIPAAASTPPAEGISELGPDREAINETARSDTLFDLGIGAAAIRFCVRSGDPEVADVLRSAAGEFAFDPAGATVKAIVSASPARVILSALGRIEVYQTIPEKGEHSPRGPHTHLLPALFGSDPGPIAAATPPGFVAGLTLHPKHPQHDKYGEPTAFDHEAQRNIDRLLARFS